jgi:prepilin-type processing-associated H-X9-DG protein
LNSVPVYFCPSRRPAGNFVYGDCISGADATDSEDARFGPQSDYAIVYGTVGPGDRWPRSLRLVGDSDATSHDQFPTPFRLGMLAEGSTSHANWLPRDTFAWIQDGTSNQILIGEKSINKKYINNCQSPVGENTRSSTGDCSILVSGRFQIMAVSRSPNAHFAKGPEDIPDSNNGFANDANSDARQWGGIHPDICNFLFGDGSVKAISYTIPTGAPNDANYSTSMSILARLGVVNDGNPVQLP